MLGDKHHAFHVHRKTHAYALSHDPADDIPNVGTSKHVRDSCVQYKEYNINEKES